LHSLITHIISNTFSCSSSGDIEGCWWKGMPMIPRSQRLR
jgi:hypothetical protein